MTLTCENATSELRRETSQALDHCLFVSSPGASTQSRPRIAGGPARAVLLTRAAIAAAAINEATRCCGPG